MAFPWKDDPKGGNYDGVQRRGRWRRPHVGTECHRYNWQTGRCGSIALGRSHRRGKTLILNPCCLVEKTSGDNLEEKSGVESLKGCDAKL